MIGVKDDLNQTIEVQNMYYRGGDMAWWVKVLAINHDDLVLLYSILFYSILV